jgi:hypothetical protein
MKKDTYWFPHDFDPTGDPKMQALLGEYGGVGYGAYWRIIEMLHADSKHRLPLKPYIYLAIAKQMTANVKQSKTKLNNGTILPEYIKSFIHDCIHTFELFKGDEHNFWVERVDRNLDKRKVISEERAKAGKRSAIARQKSTKDRTG